MLKLFLFMVALFVAVVAGGAIAIVITFFKELFK